METEVLRALLKGALELLLLGLVLIFVICPVLRRVLSPWREGAGGEGAPLRPRAVPPPEDSDEASRARGGPAGKEETPEVVRLEGEQKTYERVCDFVPRDPKKAAELLRPGCASGSRGGFLSGETGREGWVRGLPALSERTAGRGNRLAPDRISHQRFGRGRMEWSSIEWGTRAGGQRARESHGRRGPRPVPRFRGSARNAGIPCP